MKNLIIIILCTLLMYIPVQNTHADIYIDISAEYHNEIEDSFYQNYNEPIKNLIGTIEVGYEYEKYSVFFKHSSSLQQEDTGLNTIGIKIRVTD